jgi:hypothetical protein
MLLHRLQALPNQEAANRQTQEKAYERYDRHPFLARILLIEPRTLYFAFSNPAGVEISTVMELESRG